MYGLNRPVLDKTGLPESTSQLFGRVSGRLPNGVIEDQLGLKLESQKAPVDVLVIDHIEKPSEN